MKKEDFLRNKGSLPEKTKLAKILARDDGSFADIKTSKSNNYFGESNDMIEDDNDIG